MQCDEIEVSQVGMKWPLIVLMYR